MRWLKPTVCFNNLDVKIKMNNVNTKGKITELEILTHITKLGYSVSIPFGDKDKYDQIWDINGKLIKVQIKTCRWKDDRQIGIIFNCFR